MSMLERFVNKFKADGEDHIRISPFAETKLGKITSKDWRHTFFIPHMGEFTSPVCFANWISTGDDDARHNVNYRVNETVKGYLNYILYAKYYQLCSMKSMVQREMKDLPFVAYKEHATGLKEFDRWKEYPPQIRDFIDHILDEERGSKVPYPWEDKFPGLEKRTEERIREMIGDVVVKPQPVKKQKNAAKHVEADQPVEAEEEIPSTPATVEMLDGLREAFAR